MNNGGRGRGGGGLGFLVSGIAAGVGLASESIHHHKEKKAAKKSAAVLRGQSAPEHPQIAELPEECSISNDSRAVSELGDGDDSRAGSQLGYADDEQWDLDDAQDTLIFQPPDIKKRPFERDPKKVTQHFINDYPLPNGFIPGKLALPVILPQRRPKDRTRGFIRAYAPALMNCGIDQAMFLDFLETFNLASSASPWINAINMAGFACIADPTGISQVASLALVLAAEVASNMQSRHRYSSFLDQINDAFFRPRGLYCMVLTWKPESDDLNVGVNINETILSNLTPPEGIAKKTKHSLRPSMGKTNGVAFTETAPLVFPALDHLDGQNTQEAKTKKAKLKSAANFTGDYFDRRAQAKYAGKNPDSHLVASEKPKFTSRYSDPNHASNSGDMVALLTGGKLSMPQRGGFGGGAGGGFGGRGMGMGGDRSAMSNGGGRGGGRGVATGTEGTQPEYAGSESASQHSGDQQQHPNQKGGNGGGPGVGFGGPMAGGFGGPGMLGEGVKRILRHHVLYLLIVNMPTDEEMAVATRVMDQARQQAA